MKTIKTNWPILAVMTAINFVVLFNFYINDQLQHGVGYFVFFYLASFLIHIFTARFPPKNTIEVKNSAKERAIVLLFAVLGIVFIGIDFYLRYKFKGLGFLFTLPIKLGVFIFTIPLGILIYFLRKKYKILDLGLKTTPIYLLLGVLIWGLTGVFSYFFYEEGMVWSNGLKEFGGVSGFFRGYNWCRFSRRIFKICHANPF
jgi:hypothetical protein